MCIVLILVVVDDGLVLWAEDSDKKPYRVLILIVVDDGLVRKCVKFTLENPES